MLYDRQISQDRLMRRMAAHRPRPLILSGANYDFIQRHIAPRHAMPDYVRRNKEKNEN